MLAHAPAHVQHLAISVARTDSDIPFDIAPSSTGPSPLSSLVYLEFIDGLTLTDWTYQLDATSPPVFAAQLTHLALRVQWQDRAAATARLPSLPSLYPSLTHVHVGAQGKRSDGDAPDDLMGECAEWDAAVWTVRGVVGSAWCESVNYVVAWREDVAWRRRAGLLMPEWFDVAAA